MKKFLYILLCLFAFIAHATIGNGTITVGGDTNPDLANLNRDITKSDEITRDQITHALDATVSVDNRIFTESGRENIAEQHEKLVDNTIIATTGAVGTVVGTAEVMLDVATGETAVGDAVSEWRANQSGMATGIRRGGDNTAQDIIAKIDSGTATPEELQQLASMTADGSVNLVYGDDTENIIVVDRDNAVLGVITRNGFNDLDNTQGYINAANGAGTDAHTFLLTDAEERAHNYVGANEELAKSAASKELGYYNVVSGLTGGYTVSEDQGVGGVGTRAQNAWNATNANNELLLNNTATAQSVTGPTADFIFGELTKAALSPYYMITEGVDYKGGKKLVLERVPGVAWVDNVEKQLVSGIVNTIDAPFEAMNDVIGIEFQGPVKTTGDLIYKGAVSLVGENGAEITFDTLSVIGVGKAVSAGSKAASTVGKAASTAGKVAEKAATGGMSVVDDVVKGGSYSQVKKANVGLGGEVHHVVADSVSPIPKNQGPSIWMEKADHASTGSYKNSSSAQSYRQTQANLIEQGKIRDAAAMDIWQIKNNTGTKYNDSLLQMIESMKKMPEFKK